MIVSWFERVLILFSIAGGGGSSSGGGGGGSSSSSGSGGEASWWDLLVFLAIVGAIIFVAMVVGKIQGQKLEKSSKDLSQNELKAKELFLRYQRDWSNNDVRNMKAYMTERYHRRAALMVKALEQQERRNEVVDIDTGSISEAKNSDDESTLSVTFRDASATDKVINIKTGEVVNSRCVSFTETWNFVKGGSGELLLDDTTPGTVSRKMLVDDMCQFALKQELEYSLDWGTLTLPTRGVIFDKGSFAKSDINNYMVGEYKRRLVQMYSYTPNVDVQVNGSPYPIYLVGQIAVPGKQYGGIIVMKNKLIDRKPRGYRKYDLEWGDFNKKYDVFATDIDKVTSFELLNPAFMEYLHDRVNLDFTLEVVDNIIYFYAKIKKANIKDYETLLEVLTRAHQELRM